MFEVLEVMEGSTELDRQLKEQELLDRFWSEKIMNMRKRADKASYRKTTSEETKAKLRLVGKTHPNVIANQFKPGHIGLAGKLNPMYGMPSPTKGKPLGEKHKEKIGAANRRTVTELWKSESYAARMSQAHKGKHSSPQTQFKPGEARHAKTIVGICLTSPDGVVFSEVTNIKAFALEHNLDPGRLSLLLRGKLATYKGWTCVKAFCAEVGVPYQVNDINWIIRKSADPE